MKSKLLLVLGCVALLATFSAAAFADAITFSFIGTSSTPPVLINSSGVTLGPAVLLSLSDSKTNLVFLIPGTAFISTSAASSYSSAGGVLTAQFTGANVVQVEVLSVWCVGGTMPGVCLQGSNNYNGAYVAFQNSTGSFQGLFQVDYVSPYVTSLFGEPNLWLQPGSDSFTTSHNSFSNGGKTDKALLGQGGITFQTVPEPGTLAMFGAGVLGLGGLIRRKLR
jgi:hypothetical protein